MISFLQLFFITRRIRVIDSAMETRYFPCFSLLAFN